MLSVTEISTTKRFNLYLTCLVTYFREGRPFGGIELYSNLVGFLVSRRGRLSGGYDKAPPTGRLTTGDSVSVESAHVRHFFSLSAWTTCSAPLLDAGHIRKLTIPVCAVITKGPVYKLSHGKEGGTCPLDTPGMACYVPLTILRTVAGSYRLKQ